MAASFDLILAAYGEGGTKIEVKTTFTLQDCVDRNSLLIPLGNGAIELYDKFVEEVRLRSFRGAQND